MSKVATVGNANVFGRSAIVIKINGNINKIFNTEQVEEYIEHIATWKSRLYDIKEVWDRLMNKCKDMHKLRKLNT